MADVTLKDINTVKSPDTLFQAAVGVDRNPSGAPLSNEARVAAAIRQQIAVDNPRSATEQLIPKPPPSKAEAMASAEANFSKEDYDKSAKTWKRRADAETRFNDTTRAIDLSHSLLEKGYDKMGVGEQKAARETVQKALEGVWPDAKRVFDGLNPDDVAAMMTTFLKDPKFVAEMRTGFIALKDKRLPPLPPDLKQKFEEAKNKFEDAKVELSGIRSKLKHAEEVVEEFNDVKTKGKKGKELADLGTSANAQLDHDKAERDYQADENTIRVYENSDRRFKALDEKKTKGTSSPDEDKEHAALDAALKANKSDYDRAVREIATKKADLLKAKAKLDRIKQLEDEKKQAHEAVAQLTDEEVQAKIRRNRAEAAKFAVQADFEQADIDRKALETQYVKDWQDLMARAAETTLEGRMTVAEEARLEIAKKAIDDAFKQEIINRWNKLGKKKPELNEAMVKADFARLLDPTKGPQAIVIEAIRDASLKTTGTRISENEAKDYLLKNPDQAKEAERAIVQQLLSKVIQKGSGVKLNEEHARIIQANEWGVNALADALEKNETAAGEIEQLRAQGLLRPDFKDRLKEVAKRVPWTTLMLVLMGAAGAGFALGPTLGHLVAESGAIPLVKDQVNTWKDILGYGSKVAATAATGGGGGTTVP